MAIVVQTVYIQGFVPDKIELGKGSFMHNPHNQCLIGTGIFMLCAYHNRTTHFTVRKKYHLAFKCFLSHAESS